VTPDERTLLQSFLTDLTQTPNVAKDPEADAMINDAVRANPSAVYLLVQHAILADQALHAAQAQMRAQQQVQPAPSFLPQQTGAPQPPWAGQGGAPVQSSPFAANSGLGGFLKSAGTMAAGVAAGDFLFQGIENIFSPRW
jgi:uncharacterized protein